MHDNIDLQYVGNVSICDFVIIYNYIGLHHVKNIGPYDITSRILAYIMFTQLREYRTTSLQNHRLPSREEHRPSDIGQYHTSLTSHLEYIISLHYIGNMVYIT